MSKTVLDVGNCDPDHGSITRLLKSNFDELEIVRTHGMDDALEALGSKSFDLVLVNRLMDRDGSSGLEIIKRIKSDESTAAIPTMMITNFADHQQLAVDAGAELGFGKSELDNPTTTEKLRPFLA